MAPSPWDLILLEPPEDDGGRLVNLWLSSVVEAGFLEEKTLEKAREEIREWYANPEAFSYNMLVFAAGRA
jgi:hypothetical protein